MRNPNLLIAIEGPDAAGKATQCAILAKRLDAVLHGFPDYATTLGRKIFNMLREDRPDPYVLQSMMTVNRLESLPNMERVLHSGLHLVLDRYYASGIVYGMYDGLPYDWLMRIHDTMPKPDVYILLDIPPAESFKRRPKREDAYEADLDRICSVSRAYHAMWRNPPATRSWRGLSTIWETVDGMDAPEIVSMHIDRIVDAVQERVKNYMQGVNAQ